jgi:ligand-binding sensor domain-containing protein
MIMEHLNNSNSGLPANYISQISIDKNNKVWFGGVYNVNMGYQAPSIANLLAGNWVTYDSIQFPAPYMRQGQGAKVTSTLTDLQSNVWVAMGTNDLLCYKNNVWVLVDTLKKLRPTISISKLALDKHGLIWAGTSAGLASIHNSNITLFDTLNSDIPNNSISAVTVDNNNIKWLISSKLNFSSFPPTYSFYLVSFNDTTWSSYPILQSSSASVGSTLTIDKHNKKWISVNAKEIWSFDNGSWEKFDSANTMGAITAVSAFAIDTNDAIWVALRGDTLIRYDKANHPKVTLSNLDDFDNYGKVLSDFQGNIWIVSNDKISISRNGTWEKKVAPQPRMLSMRCSAIDKNNNLWVGYYDKRNGGVGMYNGSTWHLFDTATSNIQSNYINAIACDSEGTIWVGTDKGPSKYTGTTWINYNESNSAYTGYQTYAIGITKDNRKIFGCGQGAYILNGSTWQKIPDMPGNIYYSICVDSSGKAWFAVHGSGIAIYDGSNVNWLTMANTILPDNQVFWISIDKADTKWISTWKGLARLNGNAWEVYTNYNSGLPHNSTGASHFDSEGKIWLETFGGIAVIEKNSPTHTLYTPPIRYVQTVLTSRLPKLNDVSCYYTLRGQKISGLQQTNIGRTNRLPLGIYLVRANAKY